MFTYRSLRISFSYRGIGTSPNAGIGPLTATLFADVSSESRLISDDVPGLE